MAFYLYMEAVNLDNFISDTQDLSTIRGGSLLLLRATERIKNKFKQLEIISTGASSGLFKSNTDLKQEVIDYLEQDTKLKNTTLLVNSIPVSDSFYTDRETLIALTRWQQMQSATVIYPELQSLEHTICEVDFIRPSNHSMTKGEATITVSESVYQRRRYGNGQKRTFYRQEIEKLENSPINIKDVKDFIREFNELTEDKKQSNLNGKMAVIYLDGNGFGQIEQHMCKEGSEDGLREFDNTVKTHRRSFLANLLKETLGKPTWTTPENRHRLEILLWGGDEMILVVPAWQGWWTLSDFFQYSKEWSVFNPAPKSSDIPLTHAAGLVFCHHHAPIHSITKLAKELAQLAKNKSRTTNCMAYQILESFDYTGDDLEKFRQQRCPKGINSSDLLISGENMDKVLSAVHPIKRNLSKGKVYRLVEAYLHDNQIDKAELTTEVEQILKIADYDDKLNELANCFGKDATLWIHLIELWDYLELESTVDYEKQSQSEVYQSIH